MQTSPTISRRSSESDECPSPKSRSSPSTRAPPPTALDFSSIPPLSHPSPPTNTLLITNLLQADIFRPENLLTIRDLIAQTAPIHSWAPLKSFRRIIVSFFTDDDAVRVRSMWDCEAVMGERVRVYFGTRIPVEHRDEHLALPDAGKLFFISPPPSPPVEWEMRLEDAPNKQVHADDLADALAKLHRKRNSTAPLESPVSPIDDPVAAAAAAAARGRTRSHSSTVIYQPDEHASPEVPAISVEDTTDDEDVIDLDPVDGTADGDVRIPTSTSRPPVELMQN